MPPDSTPPPDFSVRVAPGLQGGVDVAVLGELDLATADVVQGALDEAMEADGQVVIDLRACGFVDSRGIAVLIKAALRLHEQGRRLRIQGVQERVMRILELGGITSMDQLDVEPDAPPRPA
jgi:anti-sigma B factor antagonist